MGSLPEEVDVAVIGGGVGGYVAAIRAAQLGKQTVLVEKESLGGHCLNYACIPSKTLIHIADIFYSASHSERFGINAGKVEIDAKKMLEWRTGVSKKLAEGVAFLCKSNGVEVIKGTAAFTSSNSVQVSTGSSLNFKKAIVATGSEPVKLRGFEFDDTVIDYKAALLLDHIPASMAIIGGGYVAVELSMLYAKLGSEVSILSRAGILSKSDPEAVQVITKKMDSIGIKVYPGVVPVSHDNGKIMIDGSRSIQAEKIVIAIGLAPYTRELGLERTKVKTDVRGFIQVDAQSHAAGDDRRRSGSRAAIRIRQ